MNILFIKLLLGVKITDKEIENHLESLCFNTSDSDSNHWGDWKCNEECPIYIALDKCDCSSCKYQYDGNAMLTFLKKHLESVQ